MAITNQLQRMDLNNKSPASASMYYLDVKKGVVVYRYDVEISQNFFGKERILTRRAADDGQKILYRRLCDSIIRVIRERFNFNARSEGAAQKQPFVYDGKKNLYLLKPTDYKEHTFIVHKEEVGVNLSMYLCSDVNVKIQRSSSFELALSTFMDEQNPVDNSLRTFFELLTTQSFYNHDTYDVVNSGMIFHSRIVRDNVYMLTQLKSGFKKGVRFIKNNHLALVLDVVSSVFYPSITIFDMYAAFKQLNKPDQEFVAFLRGVRGYLVHDPRRTVVFDGFSAECMQAIQLETHDGGQVSFVDFYANKKHRIRDAGMRAVRVDNRKPTFFPPELFRILPYQRVPLQKTNLFISSAMLRANSTKPFERHRAINDSVRLLDDQFLALFGVTVKKGSMITADTLAKRLNMPKYKLYNSEIGPEGDRGEYRVEANRSKFVEGASIKNWTVLSTDMKSIVESLKQLVETGRRFGMQIAVPKMLLLSDLSEKALTNHIQILKNDGCEFVMLCDNKNNPTHNLLKSLEQKLAILTQHVSLEALVQVKQQTLRNILLKMNMKNGGLNYIPLYSAISDKFDKNRLDLSKIFVFSYDVSHPAPATPNEKNSLFAMGMQDVKSLEPSVVGFAANMGKNPYNFIGDYFFQTSRRESMDPDYLSKAFQYSLSKAKDNRAAFNPKIVVVIRDGVSEGEYRMAVEHELEILRGVGKKYYEVMGKTEEEKNWNMQFVFVVVNKRHGKRFFTVEGNSRNNLNKCSAIDTVVVRPDINEFYMMSHTPIRGTAKIPQYAILKDDISLPQNVLEDFLHVMCHSHQVSLGGVSIPAPVYLAHELAKRGRNNFLCARDNKLKDPSIGYDITVTKDDAKFIGLTKEMGYRKNKILSNYRFTA